MSAGVDDPMIVIKSSSTVRATVREAAERLAAAASKEDAGKADMQEPVTASPSAVAYSDIHASRSAVRSTFLSAVAYSDIHASTSVGSGSSNDQTTN